MRHLLGNNGETFTADIIDTFNLDEESLIRLCNSFENEISRYFKQSPFSTYDVLRTSSTTAIPYARPDSSSKTSLDCILDMQYNLGIARKAFKLATTIEEQLVVFQTLLRKYSELIFSHLQNPNNTKEIDHQFIARLQEIISDLATHYLLDFEL